MSIKRKQYSDISEKCEKFKKQKSTESTQNYVASFYNLIVGAESKKNLDNIILDTSKIKDNELVYPKDQEKKYAYAHPKTPYESILIFHGHGTGMRISTF